MFTTANKLPKVSYDRLGILPAPESKALWQYQVEELWKCAYIRWLAKWDTGAFTMEELMRKSQAGSSADKRKQMWLREIDEFGMMMTVVVDGPLEHELDQSSRRCNIDIVLSDDGTFESSEDIHKQSG